MPRWNRPITHKDLKQVSDVLPGIDTLTGQRAERTLSEYRKDAAYYLLYCGWQTKVALDAGTLRRWRQHLVEHTSLSPNTINRRLSAIKSLVKSSAACGCLPSILAADFALVEKVGVGPLRDRLQAKTRLRITPAQVRELCRAPDPTTLIGLRDRAFLATLAGSGCRLGEVVSLKRQHIVRRRESWALEVWGKRQSRERLAPLSLEAYQWIQRWLGIRDQFLRSDWIFTAFFNDPNTPLGHALSRPGAYLMVRKYTRQLGLEHFTAHSLRRFVGTELAEKFGVRVAQKALGHASLRTTEEHYILDGEVPMGLTDRLY